MSALLKPQQEQVGGEDRWLGIYDGLDDQVYHGAPGMSNSGLSVMTVSPLQYITEKRHPKPRTDAMRLGSALHCLILEPDLFPSKYIAEPPFDRRTKEGKAASNAFLIEAGDREPLSTKPGEDAFWKPSDWDMIHRVRDSVMAHPFASTLIDSCDVRERSCWWVDKATGKLCKCRIDGYSLLHRMIVDLKSTADATMGGFARSVNDYRYYVQSPWYQDGAREVGMDVGVNRFVFIVFEKAPPWHVACYKLTPNWEMEGRMVAQRDMEVFKQCHDTNEWPGLGWREQFGIRDMEMPRYAQFHNIS